MNGDHQGLEPVRTVVRSDALELVGLLGELGYHVDEAQMSDRLGRLIDDSTYAAWLTVDDDGRAVGLAAGHLVHPLEDSLPAAQLIMLVTASTSRGKGIGKSLMKEFHRWAAQHRAGRAIVTSGAGRADAHAFYQACGFARTGERFSLDYHL